MFNLLCTSVDLKEPQCHVLAYGFIKVKEKGKGRAACYSAAYTSQTCDRSAFAVSEVAADWHGLMIPAMQCCIAGPTVR